MFVERVNEHCFTFFLPPHPPFFFFFFFQCEGFGMFEFRCVLVCRALVFSFICLLYGRRTLKKKEKKVSLYKLSLGTF